MAFTIEHTSVEAVEDLEKSGVEIGSLLIPILRAYELLQSAHDMKIFQDDFFNEIYNLLKTGSNKQLFPKVPYNKLTNHQKKMIDTHRKMVEAVSKVIMYALDQGMIVQNRI